MKYNKEESLESTIRRRYEILVDLYYDAMCKMAAKYEPDGQFAEDCVHITIMYIAENPQFLPDLGTSPCHAYLRTSLVNTINTERKKRARETCMGLVSDPVFDTRSCEDEIEIFKGKYGFGEELDLVMSTLKERDVELLTLRYGLDMRVNDIAKLKDMQSTTISKRLRRSLLHMRTLMSVKEGRDDDE